LHPLLLLFDEGDSHGEQNLQPRSARQVIEVEAPLLDGVVGTECVGIVVEEEVVSPLSESCQYIARTLEDLRSTRLQRRLTDVVGENIADHRLVIRRELFCKCM